MSLAVASGDPSLASVRGLLTAAAAPLVVERALWSTWASVAAVSGLYSTGSAIAVHGLSCSEAYGIFLDQGSNPVSLADPALEGEFLYH